MSSFKSLLQQRCGGVHAVVHGEASGAWGGSLQMAQYCKWSNVLTGVD